MSRMETDLPPAVLKITTRKSYLSPAVLNLFTLTQQSTFYEELTTSDYKANFIKQQCIIDCLDNFVTEKILINWAFVDKLLQDLNGDDSEWMPVAAEQIRGLMWHTADLLAKKPSLFSKAVIPSAEKMLLNEQKFDLHEVVKLISTDCPVDKLLALLLVTSLTERALGNVFLMKGTKEPFLMRDLLLTDELQSIFNKSMIALLRLLLGSVKGLNIRNLVWHGFVCPEEARLDYIAFILLLLSECGHVLTSLAPLEVVPRQLTSFNKAVDLYNVFRDKVDIPDDVALQLIEAAPLIQMIMKPAWRKALQLINSRPGHAVALMLPLLESYLRCLFGYINDCPDRILTAENNVFYTTLDEILIESREIKTENSTLYVSRNSSKIRILHNNLGIENEILPSVINFVPFVLGRYLTEALYDIFDYVQGPRLRDRFSHGESCSEIVPVEVALHIKNLSLLAVSLGIWRFNNEKFEFTCGCKSLNTSSNLLCLCNNYDSATNDDQTATLKISTLSWYKKANNFVIPLADCLSRYEVTYHPARLLKNDIIKIIKFIKDWQSWPREDFSDVEGNKWDYSTPSNMPQTLTFSPLKVKLKVIHLNNYIDLLNILTTYRPNVIFQPKQELEIISLLHRIIVNIYSALEMLKENLTTKYSLFQSKKMRSRQRETYKRQLNSVPPIIMNTWFNCLVITLIFTGCNHIHYLLDDESAKLTKILRQILKVFENVLSMTSLSVNKWDEAVQILTTNYNQLDSMFGSL